MPTRDYASRSFIGRLRVQRYRQQFLRADARLSIQVIVFTSVAALITIRNDILFGWDSDIVKALLGVRGVQFIITVVALRILSRESSPRRHDCAYALWIGSMGVMLVLLSLSRRLLGEAQGPLVACGTVIIVFLFAIRGPIGPRLIGSVVVSLAAALTVWSDRANISSVARITSMAAIGLLNTAGFVSARAFEEQRFKRFLAELEEKRARLELTRKMAELAEEKKRAETMVRARTAFLAAMSHEFRTPMNAVLGFSELLLGMPLETTARDHAHSIRESARGLLGLLNDILDFAKIDADKLVFARAPFELRTLLGSVVAMMEPMVTSRPVVVELQSSPDVPEFVIGDESRLRQVLVNLMSNAVKFTERGQVRLIVTAEPENDDRHRVSFRVEDTGTGMDANVLARLFQPFVQGDQGLTRRHQGTGLGLAITKRIVQNMGGDIQVTSEVGKGSAFWFTLTLEAAEAISSQVSRASAPKRESMAILLVDDHPINRRLGIAMLERLGYTADLAEDGPSAIAASKSKDYDVIFMDLHMPGMSGFDAATEILKSKTDGSKPRIVAMTASVFEEDREACRRAGMQDFVAKPVDLGQLDAVLSRAATKTIEPRVDEPAATRIDQSALDQLRELEALSEPGFFASILRDFMGDVPQRLERLRNGLERGDSKAVELEAHTLKTSSRTMGAVEMSNICARIEEAAHSSPHDLTPIYEWADAIDAEFRRVEPILALEIIKSRSESRGESS